MKNHQIKEIPFEEADYCVFDFETTGISARREKVIEIGIVKIRKGKIKDTFSSFINPGRHVSPITLLQLTGITTNDVELTHLILKIFISKIKEFVGNSVLVAHNLSFDYSFLKNECANSSNLDIS